MKARKGGNYEREICRLLTAWWTGDPNRDTVFWRTSQSGGRATTRHKSGKQTGTTHVGDISAIEEIGIPLTSLVTFEIKRGYRDSHIGSILDKPKRLKQNDLEAMLEQTIRAQRRATTPYWALIHRRDAREALIYFSPEFLPLVLPNPVVVLPGIVGHADIRCKDGKVREVSFRAMKLEEFLEWVTPESVRLLYTRWEYERQEHIG